MTTEARTETQGENEVALLAHGEQEFAALHARIGPHFQRAEVRERVGRFLRGLLSRIERKNGWQLAEELDESGPQGVQRLLNAAAWDEEAVRDELRAYVLEHLEEDLAIELAHGYLKPIQVDENVGLLAVVGEGMRGMPGLAGRIFTAIKPGPVNTTRGHYSRDRQGALP